MDDSKFNFWQKWLTYANVMTMVVGFLLAFFSNSFFFDIYNNCTKEIFLEGNEFSKEVLYLKNWLSGIIGATIVGFHILMVMISENAFKQKEVWAYRAMWAGLIFWFLIDSSISIYYGAIYNVIMINIVALILIGLPLLMTRKAFKK